MEWLNLHSSTLDSPEVIGADPRARATWLFLLRYCIGQENGGVIANCKPWGDRRWQQVVRVTKREVGVESELWRWEGDDLQVNFYPSQKEVEVQTNRVTGGNGGRAVSEAKRIAARANGAKGGRPPKSQQTEEWQTQETQEPKRNPSENPTEWNGMEGKGKEGARERSKLPETLRSSPTLIELWGRWEAHWSSEFNYGNPMPEMTLYQQTKDLVAMGPELAVKAIENALSNGKLKKPCLPFGVTTAPAPALRVGQNVTGVEPEPANYGPLKAS